MGEVYYRLIDQGRRVNGVAFSPDGRRAIAAGADHAGGVLRLWELPP